MKRLVACLIFAAALGLVLPEDAQAVLCKCGPQVTTPTITVTGSSCSNAASNLETNLWGYINCDLCREPVLTSTCSTIRGEDLFIIQSTGYLTYRCFQLVGACQIP